MLERDELLNFLILITGAGSDTTVNAIGWAGQLPGDHADQRRLLVKDPGLIPNAVEEVLRYESISYHMCRTTTAEVEFYGQTLAEGSLVVVLPGSANRDERRVSILKPSTSRVCRARSSPFRSVRTSASGPTWPSWRPGWPSRPC